MQHMKNLLQIWEQTLHRKMHKNRSTVSRWVNHFHGDCVSIDNDPRPGRPRTSTDETSVKLVADALEEDDHATYEELTTDMGANTS